MVGVESRDPRSATISMKISNCITCLLVVYFCYFSNFFSFYFNFFTLYMIACHGYITFSLLFSLTIMSSSFVFSAPPTHTHPTLHCSTLLCSALLSSTLLYSALNCCALLYSTLLSNLFICPLHISHTDMSRPKIGIFAKHIIPQTSFAFTLHRKDFRLLWAINCGSCSLLPLVPVYEPGLLDQQLDAVMR